MIMFNQFLPSHKNAHKKSDMAKHVHDVEWHQLVNSAILNLARFHWVTILVMSKRHKSRVEVDQENRNQPKNWDGQSNFCIRQAS